MDKDGDFKKEVVVSRFKEECWQMMWAGWRRDPRSSVELNYQVQEDFALYVLSSKLQVLLLDK